MTPDLSSKRFFVVFLALVLMSGCHGDKDRRPTGPSGVAPVVAPDEESVFAVANGCFAIGMDDGSGYISATVSGDSFQINSAEIQQASQFLLRPSDLGKYLLYDADAGYLTSDGRQLLRQVSLALDTRVVDGEVVIEDRLQSEGEWELRAAADARFNLRHIKSGLFIGASGEMVGEGEMRAFEFVEQSACAEFPELSVDASGEIAVTEFEDGSVFGFVDAHSHLFTNLAFGGGGIFHGAPFHPLGVEHALRDCELSHGVEGRKDIFGFFEEGVTDIDLLLETILKGSLDEKNHDTDGYPTFTEWPDAHRSPTHQVQYYRWLERAYKAGLRLVVQHATTQETLCKILVGLDFQAKRYDCNDMVAVDRIIEASYDLERYIDALSGGPGQGWFRIVFTPDQAREQIKAGNLAVVLGIETSDLFDCFLVPFGEFRPCTEADVIAKLDEYHDRGVRVLFPVHKFDNGFSAGDGDRATTELGNFVHSGHYASFVECSEELRALPDGFDSGRLNFANLNQPRDVYDSPPPFDMSNFEADPLGSLIPYLGLFAGGSLEGEYCQNHGLTALGEFLIAEMMKRGMVLEVDHLPKKSYLRTFELLLKNDYPAMGTHGLNNHGILYQLGGMSTSRFGRCRASDTAATMDDGFQARIQLMRDMGAFPAEGFGFDLNGLAGAPGPRFGEGSNCEHPQNDAGITYPFTSYAGDIILQQPTVGERTIDFNTEGMVHLGLVAELIEDVRRDGVTDEELEPLFKSAEGYLRVWEKSLARGAALSGQ